jgi:anti-sigma B factor antagonist
MPEVPDRRLNAFAIRVRPLALSALREGDAQVIVLEGELDMATVPELVSAIEVAEATDARIVVLDLRRLEFIDSSGIHVIVDARRRMPERLIIVRGPPGVHRVFELCGLVEQIEFAADWPPRVEADGLAVAMYSEGSPVAGSARASGGRSRRVGQAALASAIRELCSRRPAGVDPVGP